MHGIEYIACTMYTTTSRGFSNQKLHQLDKGDTQLYIYFYMNASIYRSTNMHVYILYTIHLAMSCIDLNIKIDDCDIHLS